MGTVANIIIGSATVKVDGVDVGYTQGGVTLRKSTEWTDIPADQAAGIVAKVATMERVFVNFTMLEATLLNMQNAMNEPAANRTGTSLVIGTSSPTANEHVLTLTGKAPNSGTRIYTIHRAVAVEDVEHQVGARDAAGLVPVSFECMKSSANGNVFGSFIDS